MTNLHQDSGNRYLDFLDDIAEEDAEGLKQAQKSYGDSWKKRGGAGAYFVAIRKVDRLENQLRRNLVVVDDVTKQERVATPFDVFQHIALDPRSEGVIDDIRDLRRYLMLWEAEMRARGFSATHRDNK